MFKDCSVLSLSKLYCGVIKPIPFLACQQALGMENGDILDEQITASSEKGSNHAAHQGRLHFKKVQGIFGAWTADNDDLHQWLQVDTGSPYTKVTRVATQGRDATGTNQWVTRYKLQYGSNGVHFRYYREQGQTTNKVNQKRPVLSRVLNGVNR